jgi:undecaprenyl pyrophosphate synthase
MEWTPNKLADALRNWIGNKDQLLAAANILQDQAKEIEHLRKIVEDAIKQAFYEDDYHKATVKNELLKAELRDVAEQLRAGISKVQQKTLARAIEENLKEFK